MGAYIFRRILQSLIVILGVIIITFMISRVLGDPVALLLPPEATPEQRAYLTRDLGLDRPLYVQLVVYVGKVARGDFGLSFRHQEPAMKLLLDRVPASIYLSLVATLISICIAIPLGIISAIKRGTIFDRIGMTLALLGQSIPAFWAGIMMILLFAVKLGWFPPSGYGGPNHVILPAGTLAFFFAAATARFTRSSILDVLDMDYVRYARLKGVPEFVVIMRHVLRNAFITILNIVALQLGLLLGGAVITEFIFSWPGIGRLSLDAIYNRDYPVIQATVVVAASFFVVINLLVDMIYSATDPRVGRK
ncbi:MAG: ABC transporter permease [Deltaproteobacteria bacterium]|nr:MAG: ABC transporter permease [Deltaproteobacteria bacterium]